MDSILRFFYIQQKLFVSKYYFNSILQYSEVDSSTTYFDDLYKTKNNIFPIHRHFDAWDTKY